MNAERLAQRLQWFQDLKLGFFMHWGAYSQWGCIESWPLVEVDKWARPDGLKCWEERGRDMERFKRDYFALNKTFNPVKFAPERWAEAATYMGAKYVAFTTKHHDGFCMFDTRMTDYRITAVDCPFSRTPRANVAREVFNAFRSVFADRPARPAGFNAGLAGLPIGKNIGRKLTATGKDPETINLVVALPAERMADVHRDADGRLLLAAWQPGRYELKTASGRTLRADAPPLPQPLDISGPWDLRFLPRWGAPERVTLDKLISWTEHPDAGVKYFSGTATYRKTFVLPEQSKTQNLKSKIYLDLGRVEVIAQVRLNERDLGLLWKPPFEVDITDVARPGENALEVKVANLWPNRLIGDEQLPDDCQWQAPGRLGGSSIKDWPQWLLEGKPSPTGRYTFTTWKHYTKDDPLVDSGLLGPVRLLTAEALNVSQP